MARKAKDNRAHGPLINPITPTPHRKRPSKDRGSFGTDNQTVQHRTNNVHKTEHGHTKKEK